MHVLYNTKGLIFPLQHSVSVVYYLPKRPWGKSEVSVYINGELKKTAFMKTPSFSEVSVILSLSLSLIHSLTHLLTHSLTHSLTYLPHTVYIRTLFPHTQIYTSSCIGSGPTRNQKNDQAARIFSGIDNAPPSPSLSFRSSSSGSLDLSISPKPTPRHMAPHEVCKEWGHASNLHGLISSVCVFGDTVSSSALKILHNRGTYTVSSNDWFTITYSTKTLTLHSNRTLV